MKLNWKHTHGLSDGDIALRAGSLSAYTTSLRAVHTAGDESVPEASLTLPATDVAPISEVAAAVSSTRLRYIVVIGIGGSNLGTKAIYDALRQYSTNDTNPEIVFIDTTNAAQLRHHIATIIPTLTSMDEVVLVSISKSGGTTETIANTEVLLSAYAKQFPSITERTVVITDQDSPFYSAATEAGIARLTIPAMVGGRYSVFSAVGLLPLLLAGIDIHAIRKGAQDILPYCLNEDWEHNPAIQSATVATLLYESGIHIHDTFVFHTELESLGKWYRQLLGESIGKKETVRGERRPVGFTPTVSIGSTDLHSVGQLYLGGPNERLTTFVYSTKEEGVPIPEQRWFPELVPMINRSTTEDIMQAIRGGVKSAYGDAGLPYMEIELSGITPYELGAFMQWKMVEMMYLGKLFQVNPFDQPSVESYKVGTKRILEN